MKKSVISIILALLMIFGVAAAAVSCEKPIGPGAGSESVSAPEETEGETGDVGGDTDVESGTSDDTAEDDTTEDDTSGEIGCVHNYDANIEGHWKPACDVCGKPSGSLQAHEFLERVEDEGDLWLYTNYCRVCNYAPFGQEVPYEINSFYSAGEISSRLEVSGSLSPKYDFKAGVGYAKFASASGGGSSTITFLKSAEPTFPSGNYLVMKVKLGASQKNFTASIASSAADGTYTMTFSDLGSGWVVIIVDITKAHVDSVDKEGNPTKLGYLPDAYDNYYLRDFNMSGKAGTGESFDVSYVLFCDTLKDAQTFAEGEKNVKVYNDIVNEAPESEENVCVDENGNPIIHEYVGTATGHTLAESCTQCGLAAVTNEPHNFVQMVIDSEYTYACSACKWSKFGLNINKYFTPVDINTTAITYYQIKQEGVTDNVSGNYVTFSGKGNTAQVIFSRDNSASSVVERSAAFDVGKANLFIIRMKTNTPAVSFAISFRTAVTGASQTTLEFPLTLTESGEWATYIVDLSTVIPGAYVADENGNYTLGTFYYHIGYKDFTADVKYDIEYMAFVDEWDEVKALVSDEQIVNVTGSGRGQLINTADRSCVGEHAFATQKTADGWMLVCASCGKVEKDFGVGANIEKFMPAEILKNVRTDSDGKIDLAFMEENGESFIRLSNLIPNGAGWMGLTFVSGEANVTGQYMIMKVRLGENELGTSYLQMYTGTTIGLKAEGQATSFKMVEDGEWHYVVIDLASRMGDPATYLVPNADGSYTVKYLQIRPFSGTQCYYPKGEDGKYPQRVMEDDYLDIGFIAYCDSMDDFKDIIDSESYEWSVSIGESSIRKTKDHSCVTHSVSVEITGTSQKAVCVFCGKVMRDFTLPESINWYATYSDAKTYEATVAKEMYDVDTGLVFNRFTGSKAGHLNITGGSGSGAETADEYKIGKYLVMKYRATGVQAILKLGAKNDSAYYKVLGGYQSDVPGDEWRVAVLNIEDVDVFKNDADGKSTVYYMITTSLANGSSSYTFDVAYAAIVDSLSELNLLLEENEDYYYYGADFASEPVVNSGVADGESGDDDNSDPTTPPTPTTPPDETEGETEDENGHTHAYDVVVKNGEYVYACECGAIKKEYNVSESVEGYIPAESLVKLPTNSDGGITITLKQENGMSFVRMDNMTLNKSGWMGINLLSGRQVRNVNYIVIKLRNGANGNNMSALPFYMGSTGGLKAEGQKIAVKISEDNQWHYIVIDVQACIIDTQYLTINNDGTTNLSFMQMRPISGTQSSGSDTDGDGVRDTWTPTYEASDFLDIAFIAFFNDLDEISEVVDAESYEWSIDASNSVVRKTSDHSCMTHEYKIESSATGYTVVCGGCKETFKSVTIPESVNWYSPLDTMNKYNATLSKNQFDTENLVLYNRYVGTSAGHLNLTGGGSAGTWTADKFETGKYLVIKYRAEGGSFQLYVSTKDFGENPDYSDHRPLYSGLGTIQGADTMGDWQVAVIEIPDDINYTCKSEQEIAVMIASFGSYTFDVAYVAVVDSVDEAKGLLEDGEDYYFYENAISNDGGYLNGSDAALAEMRSIYSSSVGADAIKSSVGSKEYVKNTPNGAAFTAFLMNGGFVLCESDMIDGALFEVSILKRDNDQFTVYWNEADKELRVVYSRLDEAALAPLRPNALTGTGDISVAQVGVSRKNETDNPLIGMCYVIKLSDGRAIVIDGGLENDACADNLYEALGNMGIVNDGGKYVIAAWIITHGHGDHTGTAEIFAQKYASRARVEYLVHALPGDNNVIVDGGDEEGFLNAFKTAFPETVILTAHAGLKYYFGNATIDMLYTPELYYSIGSQADYYNDSSLIFKVSGGDCSVLFLGDAAEKSAGVALASYSEECFKANIFQLTHHGLYTGAGEYHVWNNLRKIYDAADAKYAFLPMHEAYSGSTRNGRHTVLVGWAEAGCQISYLMDMNDNHGYNSISQDYYNAFVAAVEAGTSTADTLYGYNGVNKIVNSEGLVTYIGSAEHEPMVTLFKLSGGNATLVLNSKLSEWN